jgi:cell wall-associated NlpC family hydrolase
MVAAKETSQEVKQQANAVANKLNNWQNQLSADSDRYYDALDAHDAAVKARDDAKKRMVAAEKQVEATQGELNNRANAIYQAGAASFLDVLLGANSFEEFATGMDYLNFVNNETASLVQQNKAAKADAEASHAEYSKQEKTAREKLQEAKSIKAGAEKMVVDYQNTLNGLKAKEKKLIKEEQEAAQKAEESAHGPTVMPNFSTNPPKPAPWLSKIVKIAKTKIGCPYKWGAIGPGKFDCSGFVSWVYAHAGHSIHRITSGTAQYAGSVIPVADAVAGDILVRQPGSRGLAIGHVCIYLGNGTDIEAPCTGQTVSIRTTGSRFDYAVRVPASASGYSI